MNKKSGRLPTIKYIAGSIVLGIAATSAIANINGITPTPQAQIYQYNDSNQQIPIVYNGESYVSKAHIREDIMASGIYIYPLSAGVSARWLVAGKHILFNLEGNVEEPFQLSYKIIYPNEDCDIHSEKIQLVQESPEAKAARQATEDLEALTKVFSGYYVTASGESVGSVFMPTDPNKVYMQGIDFLPKEILEERSLPNNPTIEQILNNYSEALSNGAVCCWTDPNGIIQATMLRWSDPNFCADPNLYTLENANASIIPNLFDGMTRVIASSNAPTLRQINTWAEMMALFKEKGLDNVSDGGSLLFKIDDGYWGQFSRQGSERTTQFYTPINLELKLVEPILNSRINEGTMLQMVQIPPEEPPEDEGGSGIGGN